MRTAIAKRVVEIKKGDRLMPGSIQIFAPDLHPEDENGPEFWKCDYHLDFDDEQRSRYAGGVDAFQALQLALRILPSEIESSSAFRSGALHMWGKPLKNLDEHFSMSRFGGTE